jgi:hypothetical protein
VFGVILDLGDDLISCLCLRVKSRALVLNAMAENLDTLNGGGWGVFIAPTTKTAVVEGCCRWAHRTVRCASHVTQPLGFRLFRPLELWQPGPPDSPVSHRTVTVHCPVRLLALLWLCANCPRTVHVADDHWSRPLRLGPLLRWHTGQSGDLPDSPVNYSGAQPQKPEGEECEVDPPWCARPGFSSVSFASFFWTLT